MMLELEKKMKRKPLLIIVLFSIIILFNACIFKPKPDTNDYFPLKVGNTWVYERVQGENIDTISYTIIDKVKFGEYNYFLFDHSPAYFLNSVYTNWGMGVMQDSTFVRKNEFGNVQLYYDTTEYVFVAFGEQLVDSVIVDSINSYKYKTHILSIEDSVITAYGTFNSCYNILHYIPQVRGPVYYVWYAHGYGPVKIYEPSWATTYSLVDIELR